LSRYAKRTEEVIDSLALTKSTLQVWKRSRRRQQLCFFLFAGQVDDMSLFICDTTQTAIFKFPGEGTLDSYLQENGWYASTTYLYLRSQHKDLIADEFEDKEDNEWPSTSSGILIPYISTVSLFIQ
jgi:hypothetical protein